MTTPIQISLLEALTFNHQQIKGGVAFTWCLDYWHNTTWLGSQLFWRIKHNSLCLPCRAKRWVWLFTSSWLTCFVLAHLFGNEHTLVCPQYLIGQEVCEAHKLVNGWDYKRLHEHGFVKMILAGTPLHNQLNTLHKVKRPGGRYDNS